MRLSASADAAHKVPQNILELLEQNAVDDVQVEWHMRLSRRGRKTAEPDQSTLNSRFFHKSDDEDECQSTLVSDP
jgi:hypothetical protein